MDDQRRLGISVIIITQDEAKHIRECLESVSWADEIIVVDAGSQDGTPEIALRFTDKVYHNPWPGYAAQKQFALNRASQPWVLSIDSDERVTTELRDEILTVLNSLPARHQGYYIPRLSTFLGKFIYHSGWYPGYQLRLFQRDRARVTEARVHEGFLVEGSLGHLQNHLLHFTHQTLEESFKRLNRYSSLEAADRAGHKRVHWWDMLTHPLSAFFNKFIAHKGYKDGMHGFLLALVTAMVKMALYMKIWEMQNSGSRNEEGTKLLQNSEARQTL
ncbi:MAG: glycosyltransferase family 2 protein [candidate division KSB1 bacterium]|nr:glycosyltransferase family 2 protein [candidate division KSB1 bacterium]MDZ7301074.1 glycosyltransferase family 2 protein [candidate division KSB1 bacterium]MDZ7312102.1 glycosyltransferase family 2 protein [candidate division KSB1 bacterium]